MAVEPIRQLTIATIENLAAFNATAHLILTLFPEESANRVRRLVRQSGVSLSQSFNWEDPHWTRRVIPREGRENAWIIREYEGLRKNLVLVPRTDVGPHILERSAAIRTIEAYGVEFGEGAFTADGVYAVIQLHRSGASSIYRCGRCGYYWMFESVIDPRCPHCSPEFVGRCAKCGKHFVAKREAAGRPRKYCRDCNPPRPRRRKQTARRTSNTSTP